MRGIALALGLPAMIVPSTGSGASAQVSAQRLAGTYTPPRPRYATLTVRYVLVAQTKMTLSTPAGSFTCAPPGFQIGLPMVNCTLAVPRGSTVALTANFLIYGPAAQTGKGKAMSGKQWLGACAGTASDTCTLAMTEDRAVEISPYAAT